MSATALSERFRRCLQTLLDEGLLRREGDPTYELLTPHEAIVVEAIGRGTPMSMSQLARACGTLRNTTTGIVDRLVRRNVLERRRATSDRRKVMVHLTILGTELFDQNQRFMREFAARLLNRLGREERLMLISLLEKVTGITPENS